MLICVVAVNPEVLGLFATNAKVSDLKGISRHVFPHNSFTTINTVFSRCYSTTLDEDQMRTSVWWTKPKIGFLLEPHRGFPHLKASVYDCPSNGGRVVYEYMRFMLNCSFGPPRNAEICSTTMANDARLVGSVVPEVRASFYVHPLHIQPPLAVRRSFLFPLSNTIIQYWQWPGDEEALVVDLTHRVCVFLFADASICPTNPLLQFLR
jgi:hypothetical protein